jgi:predicted nucleic acid-binding protein
MIVVSDTSPLHSLILIDAEYILPELHVEVVIPAEVLAELRAENAPERLRTWIDSPPAWLDVRDSPRHAASEMIHVGEAAAIALAKELGADLLLMDDRDARSFAEQQGPRVTGVLGVLRDAGENDLIDFQTCISRLRETNFRAPPSLFDELLDGIRK